MLAMKPTRKRGLTPYIKEFVAKAVKAARRQPCPYCGGILRIKGVKREGRKDRDIVKG